MEWAKETSLYVIADGLSGLHFFWPELRGLLRNSWRMFKNWRRIEAPVRAPPLTPLLVRAMIARAVQLQDSAFGCMLAVGFHGAFKNWRIDDDNKERFGIECGILRLPQSKSGQRSGSGEAIALRDHLTLQLLDTWVAVARPSAGTMLWPHSGQKLQIIFRRDLQHLRVCHLCFTPYSVRRGGATYLLQAGLPMEAILLKGRWKSISVGRLCLQDGRCASRHMTIKPPLRPLGRDPRCGGYVDKSCHEASMPVWIAMQPLEIEM